MLQAGTVIACSKLSCLVRVSGVNTIGDKTRQVSNCDKSPIVFTLPTQTRQDSLVLSVLPISKFSVVFCIFDTEQLQIGNWVETRQFCLVLSPVLFTLLTWTRQDRIVRVGSVNKLLDSHYSH